MCYFFSNLLEFHLGPCTRELFLSTFDTSLDGLHISIELASATLLGFGWRSGFSSHIVYNCLIVRLSSDHWVCLYLQGDFSHLGLEFPIPWNFGKNLRNPLCYQGFFFLVFSVWHFSGGGSKVVSKIYLLPISARAADIFSSDQSSWRSPLLLSGWNPCPNWIVSWGSSSIIDGHSDG